ncbi:MAG TPA: phytanoyl-CoA dioxygenase family protein [Polyangia bacterium]|nr:phytanoyl-CoA dioxygenase family protein [Polyangia bacterium]
MPTLEERNTTFVLSGELDSEQREFLDTFGYIHFRGFASPAEIELIRGELAEVERAWIAEERRSVNGIPIKYGLDGDGRRFVNRFAFTSLFSPKLHAFLADPRFELVRRACGDDFRLGEQEKDGVVVNHFLNVPGSSYTRLGWHVDSLRDLFYGKMPQPMWNVGLYLDDSHRDKGALRVLPGTHRQGLFGMLFGKLHFLDHGDDPREVAIEADAGDLTLHDGRLWHRVGRATLTGAASRRRTMYLPFLNGPVQLKDERSPTPFYHRFSRSLR